MKLFIITNEFNTGYYGSFDTGMIVRATDEAQAKSIAQNNGIEFDEWTRIFELKSEGNIGVVSVISEK